MKTLFLNRESKGRYSKRVGDILIIVEKLESSKGWQGTIEKYTHTAKDIMSNDVEMFDLLFEPTYGLTKKDIYTTLINQIVTI